MHQLAFSATHASHWPTTYAAKYAAPLQASHPQTKGEDCEGMSGSVKAGYIVQIMHSLAHVCNMNAETSSFIDVGSGDNRVCLTAHLLLLVAFAIGMEVSHTRCIASEGFCNYVIKGLTKGNKYLTKADEREPEVCHMDITKVKVLPRDVTHAYVFWRSWVWAVKRALGRAWRRTLTLQVRITWLLFRVALV
jgi:hypothetical protein